MGFSCSCTVLRVVEGVPPWHYQCTARKPKPSCREPWLITTTALPGMGQGMCQAGQAPELGAPQGWRGICACRHDCGRLPVTPESNGFTSCSGCAHERARKVAETARQSSPTAHQRVLSVFSLLSAPPGWVTSHQRRVRFSLRCWRRAGAFAPRACWLGDAAPTCLVFSAGHALRGEFRCLVAARSRTARSMSQPFVEEPASLRAGCGASASGVPGLRIEGPKPL